LISRKGLHRNHVHLQTVGIPQLQYGTEAHTEAL
jgi:hypothetical protein